MHKITIAEMPRHKHLVPNLTQFIPGRTGRVGGGVKNDGDIGFEYTDQQGGDQPHNNMQPSRVLNYIIKY
jgi:microcystin-dependent protein